MTPKEEMERKARELRHLAWSLEQVVDFALAQRLEQAEEDAGIAVNQFVADRVYRNAADSIAAAIRENARKYKP